MLGLACAALWIVLAPTASASAASLTWTGAFPGTSESDAHWSLGENWEGGAAPSASQAIETLTFPHLNSSACTSAPETDACYGAMNDLSGLSAEAMQLDDGDFYFLAGEAVTLGAGGLRAEPAAGASGPGGAVLEMPIQLGAQQAWSIAGRSGGELGETALLVGGTVTGADPLTVEMSNASLLALGNETEVGPVRIEGRENGATIANGLVNFANGELNAVDEKPVSLANIGFIGTGAVGPLTTNDSLVEVGSGTYPAGVLETPGAIFDFNSAFAFQITGSSDTAQADYAQLTSTGPIGLAGILLPLVSKPSKSAPCPVLTLGQQYTFVSSTATLSGTFANAPENGPEIPIAFTKACSHARQTMRISYNRTGAKQTVTGTVEALAKERQEAEVNEQRARELREKEAKEQEEKASEGARKTAEEAAARASQGRQEEAVAAAAVKRHEEETVAAKRQAEETAAAKRQAEETAAAAAHGSVLGTTEAARPRPLTRAQLLARALKQCRKLPKRKLAKCVATARKKYAPKARGRKGAKR